MLLTTFALFLSALAITEAYKLPDNIKDGLYIVDLKAKGGPKLSTIPSHLPRRTRPRSHNTNNYRTLPVSSAGCHSKNTKPSIIDKRDTSEASKVFKNWCDAGGKMPADSIVVSKYGSVVAYGCSIWGHENPCTSKEWDEAVGLVEGLCGGEGHAGFVWVEKWAKRYGRDWKEADICAGI